MSTELIPAGKKKPPSRVNKKQLAAHLAPDLVEAVQQFCRRKSFTQQEMIAMAINAAAAHYGRKPILHVARQRLLHRVRSPSQVQTNGPECRNGKKRIAGYFHERDIERVKDFAKEKGERQETLIELGIRNILAAYTPTPAKADSATAAEQLLETV
jgi:hypothetical protein